MGPAPRRREPGRDRDARGDPRERRRRADAPSRAPRIPNDDFRLSGFGHRVYKNYDPRARILRGTAERVLAELDSKDSLFDIALELEQVALTDDYFIEQKLYPNVDFYSGLIYRAMGFPTNMFPVLFAIGRLPGWLAHWKEAHENPKNKIGRPRQIYTGADRAQVRRRSKSGSNFRLITLAESRDAPIVSGEWHSPPRPTPARRGLAGPGARPHARPTPAPATSSAWSGASPRPASSRARRPAPRSPSRRSRPAPACR